MTKQRKLTSVAAVVAAVTVPVTVAAPAALAHPSTKPSSVRLITDTLGGDGRPPQRDIGYRIITDTLAPGGGRVVVAVPAVTGFDWGDAGIGAGVAVAGAALAAAAARVVQRGRLAL
jgi:hypothetical protein